MVGTKVCPACYEHATVHSAERRARFEVLLAQEDLAAANVAELAARAAQASSSSSAPAGVSDVGSTASDVPMDAMRVAPLHWRTMTRPAPWMGRAAVQLSSSTCRVW